MNTTIVSHKVIRHQDFFAAGPNTWVSLLHHLLLQLYCTIFVLQFFLIIINYLLNAIYE